jgi:hypothetical protein
VFSDYLLAAKIRKIRRAALHYFIKRQYKNAGRVAKGGKLEGKRPSFTV